MTECSDHSATWAGTCQRDVPYIFAYLPNAVYVPITGSIRAGVSMEHLFVTDRCTLSNSIILRYAYDLHMRRAVKRLHVLKTSLQS